ncbi:RRC1, partial [Symbiodinium microadriaticum]
AQADGHVGSPSHQQQATGPLTAAEGQDTNNLYVGSLSPEWTEELLSREFGRFGEITSIKIMYPRNEQQRQRGMNSGFVQFKTRQQAEYARLKLNGKDYFGMCLRIDWGRAIQPVRNIGAIMGSTPSVITKPALLPHIETPQPLPMITSGDSSPQASSGAGERKSRWNLAKTLVVKVPEDQVLKKLIDKTAEFVADEGWDFEKLLLDKEKDNPRFSFMSTDKQNLEDPLHVYYRWRTFSFSQGDNEIYWRAEPFQIYENGPLWQPPPCEKRVEAVPDVQRIELALPSSGPAFELLRQKLSGTGASVSTSGKDNVIGSDLHELSQMRQPAVYGQTGSSKAVVLLQYTHADPVAKQEAESLQELIADLTTSRAGILKAMAFCVDKSMSSLAIAQRICASITEEIPGLATQQLVARLFLLNDVLYNSHCTKPGASQYRRQFQELLPDILERVREVCDSLSTIASSALHDRVLKLVENWTEWALFPPRFTKGLEAVLCGKAHAAGEQVSSSAPAAVQQAQQQWVNLADLATLERACRQRGLSTKGNRQRMVDRLCLFEAYWPPDTSQSSEPKLPKDLGRDGSIEPGLDGDPAGEDVKTEEPRWPTHSLTVPLFPQGPPPLTSSSNLGVMPEPKRTKREKEARKEQKKEQKKDQKKDQAKESDKSSKEAPKPAKEASKPKEAQSMDAKDAKVQKEEMSKPEKQKSPEELRREKLRQVEAEVERFRQQLEKQRYEPEVVQMKCDRRRMELLEAAAHEESFSLRQKSVDAAAAGASESLPASKDKEATTSQPQAAAKEEGPKEGKDGKQDSKSGREKDAKDSKSKDGQETKAVKDSKPPKEAAREKVRTAPQTKEREKDKDKDKEKEKAKEKTKEKEKSKPKDQEKDKDRKKRSRERRESSSSCSRSRKRKASQSQSRKKR